MSQTPPPDRVVDQLGVACPLPIIELARQIQLVDVGAVVVLLADDPAAAVDVPAWCSMRGHEFLGSEPVVRDSAKSALRDSSRARAYSVRRAAQSGAGSASATDSRDR